MRLFLFVFLHVLVFLFLLVTHPEASEDGWEIDEWNEYLVLSKNGEVVHGDKMRFALNYNNCESVSTMFTFMTTRAPKDIYQFEKKRLPIKINNVPITAEVLLVRPFYKNFGYLVAFTLGTFDLKKYSNMLEKFYKEENKYEIIINDGLNFEAKKYFDVVHNSWNLDNFPEKISNAYDVCKNKKLKDL